MATNYDINYNDERFTEVETDKKAALNEVDVTYGNMINQADKYYQEQIDAVKDYADKQTALQNQQTDFAIEKIEQQKGQAKKDYTKEQSGAYVDWQKQSNQYGANAEKEASVGLAGSGYSESSQVSMYNTYQNRITAARESYNLAVLNYDNAIKDARLQNSTVLAEIAYNALQQQLELSLQGFQYKNTLVLEKANKKFEVENAYYARYQDVLKQINTENALAEEVRQYNESKALEEKKLAEETRQYNESLKLQKAQLQLQKDEFAWQKAKSVASAASAGKSAGSSSIKKKSSGSKKSSSSSGSSIKSSTSSNKFTGSTYKEACAYMNGNGASDAASGLMTVSEWKRRKASYNSSGIGNEAVKNYSSYASYVKAYVEYATGQ